MDGTLAGKGGYKAPVAAAAKLRGVGGGFALISVTRLAMGWWSYRIGLIRALDLRVILACHLATASRIRLKRGQVPSFTHAELARSCGLEVGAIRSSLRRLERAGLLAWSDSAITFAESPDALSADDLGGLFAMLDNIPNRKRLVPFPRRMLRHLASDSTPTLIATVLGHLLRCLYYWPDVGCRSDGSCKASWIADTFGVSLRGVKSARASLISLGWLLPEEAPQWQLNRMGLPLDINLSWSSPRIATPSEGEAVFAPPPAPDRIAFAPPDSDKELPQGGSKNQEPAQAGQGSGDTGFSNPEGKGGGSRPTLRDIKAEDLRDMGRTLELHGLAVAEGLIGGSERERLLFFASVEHARGTATRNPGGFLAKMLRSRLWGYITQEDEDRANARLKAHFYGIPAERPAVQPQVRPQGKGLSDDARLVQAVRASAAKAGYRGDAFLVLRQQSPAWTRERYDRALLELSGPLPGGSSPGGLLPQRIGALSIMDMLKPGSL